MGNVRIVRRAAIGPLAEIFLATATGPDGIERPVAVKRLLPHKSGDERVIRRFAREARIAAGLTDPNLVRVLDSGTDGEGHFLVTDWVAGVALGGLQTGAAFRNVPVGAHEAAHVAERILLGLAAIHEARDAQGRPLRLLHRDVSPASILVSRKGEVFLSGLVTGRLSAISGLDRQRLARGYLPPEAVAKRPLGPASDLFPVGVLLWELLAGRRLFGADAAARIKSLDPAKLPPLPGMGRTLEPILRRLLARDPADRFASAREAAVELRRFLTQAGEDVGQVEIATLMARALPNLPPLAGGPDEFAGPLDLRPYPVHRRTRRGAPAVAAAGRSPAGRRRLGEILVERGTVRPADLEEALAIQRARGGRLGEILRERGVVSEMDLVRAASLQAGIPFVSDEKLDALAPPAELVARIPEPVARRLHAVPLAYRDGGLFVAMLEPADAGAVAEVRSAAGLPVRAVFATSGALDRALVRLHGSPAEPPPAAAGLALRLLEAMTAAVGGAAETGPELAELSRRLASALGGGEAEGETAAAGAFALAIAARAEGKTRFARPSRAGLELVVGGDLAGFGPMLLAVAGEGAASGAAAEAVAGAAALVEIAGTTTPPPELAAGILEALRADVRTPPRAIAAIERILLRPVSARAS